MTDAVTVPGVLPLAGLALSQLPLLITLTVKNVVAGAVTLNVLAAGFVPVDTNDNEVGVTVMGDVCPSSMPGSRKGVQHRSFLIGSLPPPPCPRGGR